MRINHEIEEYVIAARHHLHQHPELSLKEYATAAFIRKELAAQGIAHKAVGETGTIAYIEGRGAHAAGSRKVLLRADIDALPVAEETQLPYKSVNEGVMHACGHDIHTAALLGAARYLQEQRDSFAGTVMLAFQQAEEFGHGAQFFEEAGLTRGYDRAFALHVAPNFPTGTVAVTNGADSASCDYFKISIRGKGAHISRPHQGTNALAAGVKVVEHLLQLKAEINPLDNALIGIGQLHAGTAWNITAETATIEGTIRTFDHAVHENLRHKIQHIVQQLAALYTVEAQTEFKNFTSALLNDADAFDEAYQVAAHLVGEQNIVTEHTLIQSFTGDDFAEFIKEEKGVYVHVGTATENPASAVPLHSSNYEPDESALLLATQLHIDYALHVLQ